MTLTVTHTRVSPVPDDPTKPNDIQPSDWGSAATVGDTHVVTGSGLPPGGSVGQVVTNTAPGEGDWEDATGGDNVISTVDPDDGTDTGYEAGTTWFNTSTDVEWRYVPADGGNTWTRDIVTGGGSVATEGGSIGTTGGSIGTSGGNILSGGGLMDSGGGNFEADSGNYDGGGGNIVTSGGWLGVSNEFNGGLVGMWSTPDDPTSIPIGGFSAGSLFLQSALDGTVWKKTALDVPQVIRVVIANADGGTFTLIIDGVESQPCAFDYFGGDNVELHAAFDPVLPLDVSIGKPRAAFGVELDGITGDLLLTFLALWDGQPKTTTLGDNSLTGAGVTINVTVDQVGSGADQWVKLVPLAAFVEPTTATPEAIANALITAGLMAAS